ncbi:MAG: phosphatidylglycerophosphatase A [Parabacteroides distasonis]|nr:phosphatidylglycerophosphatase A [Parabacteroides distasonis]MBQ4163259.1 phosphatidylglycerophosphatase A [Parabacteroides sp.]
MKKVSLIHIIITTGFGSGFSPIAPGTAGALLATFIWYLISLYTSPFYLNGITLCLILFFTITGIHSTNKVEQIWGEDPSKVVVDEMVGVWIALLAVPHAHIGYAIAAFTLFRMFDIFKPLGIRKMEELKGGLGVMMDDILAGIYSFILLISAKWLIG